MKDHAPGPPPPVKLSNARLADLPGGAVLRPTYDRTTLSPGGIVHIGVGNFHRAHQAWYLHRLMQQGGLAQDWAIVGGAGVRPNDASMRDRLLNQDYLTTLIELDPSGISAEVIGSMIDYLPVEADNGALIRQMAAPETRIVALTVTEEGISMPPQPPRGGLTQTIPTLPMTPPTRPHHGPHSAQSWPR